MTNWEDYLMAAGIAAGAIAAYLQNDPKLFLLAFGFSAFVKALKDIRARPSDGSSTSSIPQSP